MSIFEAETGKTKDTLFGNSPILIIIRIIGCAMGIPQGTELDRKRIW
jgi:hypothetical protein